MGVPFKRVSEKHTGNCQICLILLLFISTNSPLSLLILIFRPSIHVSNTPALSDSQVDQIRASDKANESLLAGKDKYLGFLGRTKKAWMIPFDHNHLRITRVIKSLRLLVNDDGAAADSFRKDVRTHPIFLSSNFHH